MSKCLVIGNPNSGKTLLFNKLTGLNHKVANFPGVTVELATGESSSVEGLSLVDFPGVYSLTPLTEDERIAIENFNRLLKDPDVSSILYVLDGTRLERGLYLALQVSNAAKEHSKNLLIAINMMDELINNKLTIQTPNLSHALGLQIVEVSARKSQGLKDLSDKLSKASQDSVAFLPQKNFEGNVKELKVFAKNLALQHGPSVDLLLKSQNRLDHIFLSGWMGAIIFAATMIVLFQSIFTWSSPFMDAIEQAIGFVSDHVVTLVPQGMIADFIKDALFGGLGSFLVFVPQIFVLTLMIGFLEDSGYLARAAIICHKPLSYFGLSGKSFIPLLSGHACAIPAIFAARNIESPLKRRLTLIAIPLMSCSARLPVYGLFAAALIPEKMYLGGLVGSQGLVFFALFALGILTALGVTAVLSLVSKKYGEAQQDTPFVLELPPYRLPMWKPLLRKSLGQAWSFVSKAGGVIFVVTVAVWFLGYFPNGQGHLETSFLSGLGRGLDLFLEPLDLDWKFGVAILASFLAREVFVGTLGTLYGLEGVDESFLGLSETLQQQGLSLATGLALLAFYVIAPQCVSTLAVLKKEVGGWKLPTQVFVGFTVLAYAMAIAVYQLVNFLYPQT